MPRAWPSGLPAWAADANASDIKVRWDEDQDLFVIDWNDQDLVAFNPQTILAGTT